VKIEKKEDFDQYKGKLAGMIVLLGDMREVKMREKPMAERYDEKGLAEEFEYKIPDEKPRFDKDAYRKRMEFTEALQKFLIDEKALAVIEPSRAGDGGTVFVQAARNFPWKSSQSLGVPTVVVAIENYGRMARLLDRKVDVDLELNIANKFFDDVTNNDTIAEIPGTDPKLKDEVVMLGAHLDSWAGGTGATDNGSGSAVVMEAMRILKALDVKPRRTIRVALWSGEEQGLLGSEGYVRNHFAGFQTPTDPEEAKLPHWLRNHELAVITKPEHAKLAAYFNDDNGSGAFRGIYTQENAAARPIFESWIEPLKDLGMTTVSERNTGGTDHESFDDVGLPGFQFIQDELEYDSRTHHSNMDVYERLQRDDLMQGSVVMAWFVYNAAMRDQMLPRKPMPKPEPPKTEEKKLEEKKPEQPKGVVTQPH
jgi:carboxypeptidase Q